MILVTGGGGFLGKAVQRELKKESLEFACMPRGSYWEADKYEADGVIHLAGRCGGIQENMRSPGYFMRDNLQVGMGALEMAREFHIGKFLNISSACAYPDFGGGSRVITERRMWDGRPQETHAGYGIAKRAIMEMVDAYGKQFGITGYSLVLANLYGVGVEFDSERSHVIPALVEKMFKAKLGGKTALKVLGSGKARREFLYVDDAARAIVEVYKRMGEDSVSTWMGSSYINVGSGETLSIQQVAETIKDVVRFEGKLEWDESYPDGNVFREVDSTLMLKMGWKPQVTFKEGVKRVVEDFLSQQAVSV